MSVSVFQGLLVIMIDGIVTEKCNEVLLHGQIFKQLGLQCNDFACSGMEITYLSMRVSKFLGRVQIVDFLLHFFKVTPLMASAVKI